MCLSASQAGAAHKLRPSHGSTFILAFLNSYKNISGQVMVVEGAKPALVSIYDYYDTKDK